jgi:thiol-disulfide isomerase/thioredoxin
MTDRRALLAEILPPAAVAVGSLVVLIKSARGDFRAMVTFPFVFALVVLVLAGISLIVQRRRITRPEVLLTVAAILLAVAAPVAQTIALRQQRLSSEKAALAELAGTPAAEIRYVEAFNLDGEVPDTLRFGDRVTLLNFWATWCEPCRAEMPMLDRFRREHSDRAFDLIGVTRLYEDPDGVDEEIEEIRSFLDELGTSYPMVVADRNGRAFSDYRAESLPTSVLVDQSGRIVDFAIGASGTERLLEQALTLLAQGQ